MVGARLPGLSVPHPIFYLFIENLFAEGEMVDAFEADTFNENGAEVLIL